MKRFSVLMLIAAVLFFAVPLSAAGIGEMMGGLLTVVSDGPYDAGRNPALLTLLPKDHALGYDVSTIAYTNYDASGNIDANITGATIGATAFSLEDPDTKGFGTSIAFATKLSQGLTFGIGVNPQLKRETPEVQYSISVTNPFTTTISSKGENETIETQTAGYLSLGFSVNANLSAGIQLSLKKNYNNEREYNSGYSDGSFNSAGGKINETEEWTSSAALGLLYHTDAIHTGIMITSGSYGWQRNALSENESNMGTPADSYNVHGTTSWNGRYSEGPSAILGVYVKVSPSISLAVEGGYQLPVDFTNRIASRADNTIEKIDTDNELKNIYFIGGGASFVLSDSLVVAAGMRYLSYTLETIEKNSVERTDSELEMQIFRITAGGEWKLSESQRIILFVAADIINGTMKNTISQTDMRMSMGLDLTQTLYSAGVGVIQYF